MMIVTNNWWLIPANITVFGVLWLLFWIGRNHCFTYSGIKSVFTPVSVMVVCCTIWIIAGVLK